MLTAAELVAVMRHVYLEPKFKARIEWHSKFPGLAEQLMAQLGRDAVEQYAAGGNWPNPNAEVELVIYEEPDWDWWEPRHDHPWRRQAARDRGESA